MSTIAIIGGGFAGTLTAANLIYQARCPLRIVHIERSQTRNRGIAYNTTSPYHLLNVPAGRMSAFPDDPLHFLRWARTRNSKLSESSFVPRSLYGEYLDGVMEAAMKELPDFVSYEAVGAEAISIKLIQDQTRAVIKLANGNVIVADKVVLATGNFKTGLPCGISESVAASQRYIGDAWQKNDKNFDTIDGAVMLLGTGLTAIDKIMEISKGGFTGTFYAVSTHGLLPAAHLQSSLPSFAQTELRAELYGDLNSLFRAVKNAIRNGTYKELFDHASSVNMEVSDWRQIIDALRPHSQALWSALSDREKMRFARHLRSYWNVHRHRMAPEIAAQIMQIKESGRLQTIPGRLYSIQETERELIATITTRGGAQPRQVKVARVINCTGNESNFEKADSPLAQSLIARGLAAPHPTKLGLCIQPDGNVIDANDKPSKVLFTLGTSTIGARGESSAVPELRTQAKELAAHLLSLVPEEQSQLQLLARFK